MSPGTDNLSMKINIKPGVVIKEINGQLLHVCVTIFYVWNKRGAIPTMTSAAEGSHGPQSLHPLGLAWDWRVWGVPDIKEAVAELGSLLNKEGNDYDVVYGDPAHLDHVHVEYDPKEK